MSLIDPAGLTKIGDMTVSGDGGGMENLFDGDLTTNARSNSTVGWAGVSLPSPMKIGKMQVRGKDGLGLDSSAGQSVITLNFRAKLGVPSSRSDGDLLATVTFTDDNSDTIRELVSSDQTSDFDHVWYEHAVSSGFARAAELAFYEAEPFVVAQFKPVTSRPPYIDKTIGPVNIPLTTGSPYNYRIVASRFIPDIEEGDVLDVVGDFQVTSEESYNVVCQSCMVLGLTPNDGAVNQDVPGNPQAGEVIKINNHNGQNFKKSDEHHYTKERSCLWVADQDYPNGLYLNFVIFAASTAAGSGDKITLNSAFMWAEHRRAA